MIHKENSNLWLADEGKTFSRKADGFVMGTGIDLGVDDTIDNYEEIDLTEENDIEGILKRKSKERIEKRISKTIGKRFNISK